MYKDPDKQREANRKAQAKFKAKSITKGITSEGITDKVLPEGVVEFNNVEALLEDLHADSPKRGKDIKSQMTVMERLFYRPASRLKPGEINFVSLPGRACYG